MKTIVLAFTLKNQSFDLIRQAILKIKEKEGEKVLVIHGFMSRDAVMEKGFSTEVVDFLEETFPLRLNLYLNGPLRKEMVAVASRLEATVYAIGAVVEGVKEEVDMYEGVGLIIENIPL